VIAPRDDPIMSGRVRFDRDENDSANEIRGRATQPSVVATPSRPAAATHSARVNCLFNER
jgi:hypothetical protein